MAREIKTTLKLDGQAEFKKALTDINNGLGVLDSEMKVVDAQFARNKDSTEALSKKGEILENKMLSQADKVRLLTDALQDSAKNFGESDTKTQAWQKSLNTAQASLIKMEQAVEDNSEALEKAQRGTVSLGNAISGMSNMLGLDVPPVMQGFIDKLDGVSAQGALTAGVIIGIVTALAKMTVETAKTADELLTMSSTTGLTTDRLQELKYASELMDVSLETLTSAQTKMIRSMEQAKKGTGDAAEAYKSLGVKVTDARGQLRDSNAVFDEVIDKLGRMTNETQRDAYAMQIFGKSARELNPLIDIGSDGLAAFTEEAHKMGVVMERESLEKFGQLDDAMQRFSSTTEGLKNSLATVLLPILTALFEAIAKIPVPVLKTIVVLATVITTIVMIVKVIKELKGTFGAVAEAGSKLKDFFTGLDPKVIKTTAIIMGVVVALVALALAIAAITGKKDDMNQMMQGVGQMSGNLQQTIPKYASGTSFHTGGLAWVGEEGPELVRLPRGSQVMPHSESMGMAAGGDVFNITIDAKSVREFQDIVRIAQSRRMQIRSGYVGG